MPLQSIAIANTSTSVDDASLALMVAAVRVQVTRDFCPAWGLLPPEIVVVPTPNQVRPEQGVVLLVERLDQIGLYGVHSTMPLATAGSRPYGRVGVAACLAAPGGSLLRGPSSVSATLSHEILEMIADPGADLWISDGPVVTWTDSVTHLPHSGDTYAVECCDPTEDDCYDIEVSATASVQASSATPIAVSMSNFVAPAWWQNDPLPNSQIDHVGRLTRPFSLSPGGYAIVRSHGDEGQIDAFVVQHPTAPISPARRAAKNHPIYPSRSIRRGVRF